MPGLALNLLGPLAVTVDDRPFDALHIRPTVALCVYLACWPQRHRREPLMALLWPDWPPAAAHKNLRQNLYTLRQVLPVVAARDGRGPVPLVLADHDTLQLNPDAAVDLDVDRFTALLRQDTLAATETAVALYRGDFLADFYLPDSGPFEEWAAARRADLRRLMLAALDRLADGALECAALDVAAAYARRQLVLDNLRESAGRQLMRALARQGQRAEALAQYETCARLLRAELGIEPSAETRALAARIAAGEEASTAPAAEIAKPPRHNLPAPLTSFIGREREIAEVRRLLDSARLVTLTGAGGCGKSRLSLEVARARLSDHADGVWWVELAPLENAELVGQTVAYALGLRDLSGRSIQEALIDYLRSRHALLVLDNCEHLVAACASLAEALLRACPSLSILVTSRELLAITGETVYVVPSLAVPETDPTPLADLAGIESVRLFIERAAAIRPGYALAADNAPAVAQICQRLDGIPLAIELAAARVKALSVAQITERLDDRFRLLIGGSRTALPRQQTLRATIDWSYNLLSEPEQRLFCRLAVFRGGWTLEAAEAVCAGPDLSGFENLTGLDILDLLSHLVDKSLVMSNESDGVVRYSRLETIRQYGCEKLAESGELEQVRRRHLAYFLEFATLADGHFNGPQALEWTDRLEADYANLRAALEFAFDSPELVETGRALVLALGGSSFKGFWDRHSYFGEAKFWLEAALAPDCAQPSVAVRARLLFRHAMNSRAYLSWPRILPWLEEAVAVFRELDGGYRRDCAYALTLLGDMLVYTDERKEGLRCLRESLAIAEMLDDPSGQVYALNFLLGVIRDFDFDFAGARALAERGLTIARETGDAYLIAVHLYNMAEIETKCKQYSEGRRYWQQALEDPSMANSPAMTSLSLWRLGDIARAIGDYSEAEARYRKSLAIAESVDWLKGTMKVNLRLAYTLLHRGVILEATTRVTKALKLATDNNWRASLPFCLIGLAGVFAVKGNFDLATQLLGALDARLRLPDPVATDHQEGDFVEPEDRLEIDCYHSVCRTNLGQEAFSSHFTQGQSLTLDEALALGQAHLT